jgi:hypothetical protein
MAHPTPQGSPLGTIAPLTNVSALATAVVDTLQRGPALPGLICLYGHSGYGKSTAAAYAANRWRCYYVELKSLWSVKHLLAQILKEMGILPGKTVPDMLDQVCEQLTLSNRPLIIDQADYLVDHGRAQVLMDLYEGSRAPIIFIGEEGLASKMKGRHNTVHRRVLHWIEAQPASPDDCRLLADLYCPGLDLADDLLHAINAAVDGCTGRVAVNLHRIQAEAGVQGWKRVDLAAWGSRALYSGEPRRG